MLIATASGQTISANATADGVQMFVPGDPVFDSTLAAKFPTIASSPLMPMIRPMLVILVNNDLVSKHDYAVRWTLSFAESNTIVLDNVVFLRNSVDGDIDSLGPGQSRLLSPVFNYSPQVAAKLGDLSRVYDAQSFPTFPRAIVSVSLDAVIAEDDSVDGPNQTGLLLRHACWAKARADEGREILMMLNQGASSDQIQTMLQGQAKPTVPVTGKEDAQTFYSYALSDQAQAFLNAIQNRRNLQDRAAAMERSGGHAGQLCQDANATGGTLPGTN